MRSAKVLRSVLAFLAPVTLAVLVSCSSDSTREGFDEAPPAQADGGAQPPGFGEAGAATDGDGGACTDDVDVVLVLDVSSSMGFVLDKLDAEIDAVVTASNALKAGAHFGLVLFVDNVKIVDTGDLENGKVHTKGASLRAAFTDAKATYTTPNRNPGDGPTGPETQNPICEEDALDALHDTASLFPWRPTAARVAIVVTDDTFLEKADNYGDRDGDGKTDQTNYPREGNYPARFTVDETVTALKQKGVRVFSFTRVTPLGPFDFLIKCGTGRRHTEGDQAVTFGWSTPYHGKPPIPSQTGGKNFDLDEIRSGKLSLAATINEVVLESHCAGPPK